MNIKIFSWRPLVITCGLVIFLPAVALANQVTLQKSSIAEVSTPLSLNPAPNYVTGIVVSVSKEQVVLKTYEQGNLKLNILPTTKIWKGAWNNEPINVGDQIKAWGIPLGEGVYNIEKMWINIVNLQGTISSVKPYTQSSTVMVLQFDDYRQGKQTVIVEQQTLVQNANGKDTTFGQQPITLVVGQFWQIIGLKQQNGFIRATRLLH